jgi:hypothetical protein
MGSHSPTVTSLLCRNIKGDLLLSYQSNVPTKIFIGQQGPRSEIGGPDWEQGAITNAAIDSYAKRVGHGDAAQQDSSSVPNSCSTSTRSHSSSDLEQGQRSSNDQDEAPSPSDAATPAMLDSLVQPQPGQAKALPVRSTGRLHANSSWSELVLAELGSGTPSESEGSESDLELLPLPFDF